MLSEFQKYGLGLILAGQYVSQIDREVFDAILGNVGTNCCFRLGANHAALFARHLATPRIMPRDLLHPPNHEMFVRLKTDGAQTRAFSVGTIVGGF